MAVSIKYLAKPIYQFCDLEIGDFFNPIGLESLSQKVSKESFVKIERGHLIECSEQMAVVPVDVSIMVQ